MNKDDLDTVTNIVLNNEYKLHEDDEINEEKQNKAKINNDNKNKKTEKKKKSVKQKIIK